MSDTTFSDFCPKPMTAYDRYEERNRIAFEQALFQAQNAAIRARSRT